MKIFDVIEYEGDNDVFIYKHPATDFNTLSRLIVRNTQEAVLVKDGIPLDTFPPGNHVLETKNIPLLRKLIEIPYGGVTPFQCEVYFINKTEQSALKWGVGNLNYHDPTFNNYPFKIGASGEMTLRVSDSQKILEKLVGTQSVFNHQTLKTYFKEPIQAMIKEQLPTYAKSKDYPVDELESHLSEFSDVIKYRVSGLLEDYGVTLEKFWVEKIVLPENDQFYIAYRNQRGQSFAMQGQHTIDLQAQANRRELELLDYEEEQIKKRMDADSEYYRRKVEVDSDTYRYQQTGITAMDELNHETIREISRSDKGAIGAELTGTAMHFGTGVGIGNAYSIATGQLLDQTINRYTQGLNPNTNINQNNSNIPNNQSNPNPPGKIQLAPNQDSDDLTSNPFAVNLDAVTDQSSNTVNESTENIQNQSTQSNNQGASLTQKVEQLKILKDMGMLTPEEFEQKRQELIDSIMKS